MLNIYEHSSHPLPFDTITIGNVIIDPAMSDRHIELADEGIIALKTTSLKPIFHAVYSPTPIVTDYPNLYHATTKNNVHVYLTPAVDSDASNFATDLNLPVLSQQAVKLYGVEVYSEQIVCNVAYDVITKKKKIMSPHDKSFFEASTHIRVHYYDGKTLLRTAIQPRKKIETLAPLVPYRNTLLSKEEFSALPASDIFTEFHETATKLFNFPRSFTLNAITSVLSVLYSSTTTVQGVNANVYTMTLGSQASGKSFIQTLVKKGLTLSGNLNYIGSQPGSDEALLELMRKSSETQQSKLLFFDEAQDFFKDSKKVFKASFNALLKEAYTGNVTQRFFKQDRRKTDDDGKSLPDADAPLHPRITASFAGTLSVSDHLSSALEDGFIRRNLISLEPPKRTTFNAEYSRFNPDRPSDKVVEREIAIQFAKIAERKRKHDYELKDCPDVARKMMQVEKYLIEKYKDDEQTLTIVLAQLDLQLKVMALLATYKRESVITMRTCLTVLKHTSTWLQSVSNLINLTRRSSTEQRLDDIEEFVKQRSPVLTSTVAKQFTKYENYSSLIKTCLFDRQTFVKTTDNNRHTIFLWNKSGAISPPPPPPPTPPQQPFKIPEYLLTKGG